MANNVTKQLTNNKINKLSIKVRIFRKYCSTKAMYNYIKIIKTKKEMCCEVFDVNQGYKNNIIYIFHTKDHH